MGYQKRVGSSKIAIFAFCGRDIFSKFMYMRPKLLCLSIYSLPMAFHRHRNIWPWMTLNSYFALNTVFRVESFSKDAPVLRSDCFKNRRRCLYTVSCKDVAHGLWFLAIFLCRYSSGFAGEVVSNASVVVENASFLSRSLYFPYRNLHGFARFPGDSTALVCNCSMLRPNVYTSLPPIQDSVAQLSLMAARYVMLWKLELKLKIAHQEELE